ncbi:MAG: hypothetical protein ACRDT6_09500 [Micromonosporaceae bacterium]
MATAPQPPDPATATVDDWNDYKGVYADWVDKATDADLLVEMAGLPVDGQPFTLSQAWRYHQCELRRRQPPKKSTRTGTEKG